MSLPPGAPPALVVRHADARWLASVGPAMSPAEAAEAAGMGPQRREAYVLGRTLARRTIAETTGARPLDVVLAREADGRPLTAGHTLSLTHTRCDGRAVAGVVLAPGPVGIDAEPVRARAAGLAGRILAEGERLPEWPSGPEAQVLAAWTAKEAVLKADGVGLRQGAHAARIVWRAGGAFDAVSPNGRWAGQSVERDGLVWAVAWAAERR